MIFAIINDEETTYSIKELWQYDYGQVLRIQNLNTEKYAIEIHFSIDENFGESITRIATNNGGSFDVTIPDSVLENKCASKDYFIYAFIYITGQSSGNTIKKIIIPVRSRPKPEGREQNDNNTMTAILKAVNSIADGKADGLKYEDGILYLMAGEKNIASVTITGGLGSGTDGREVELQNNGIHIQWRYEGEESWTNLIALEDIKGPAGPAGEKGDPGAITPEQISGAVEEYFASNPIQAGATEDQARQIEKNTQDISKLSDEIDGLKSSGTGASDTAMSLILALFRKTKFYEDASTEYSQLEAIVKSDTVVYTITSNLTNVSSNNSATSGEENSSYICTLTAYEGYSMDSVTVVMGGSDITSTAYNNETGEIAISKLTGNIVITASAVSASLVYLYNNGDQCTDITGGWYTGGPSASVSKTIDGLSGYTFICTHTGYDRNSRAMMVNNIDLSNYKKFGFKVYSTLETLSDTVIAYLSYLDNSSGSLVRSNKVEVTLNSLGNGWYEGEADLSYSVETLVNNAHTGVSATNGNINQIWLE